MAQLWAGNSRQKGLILRMVSSISLMAAVWWVFQRIPQHQFVNWDDPNIFPESLSGHWLSRRSLDWVLAMDGGDWQPLARVLLAAQAAFIGVSANAVHTSSLICHGLNSVLLFFVVEKILRLRDATPELSDRRAPSAVFLAVGLVMLHPLRVETVAWAASQSTLWCTTSVLCALLFFLALVKNPQKKSHAFLAVAFMLTALLIKPNAISAVLWLFMLAWYARPTRRLVPKTTSSPEGMGVVDSLPIVGSGPWSTQHRLLPWAVAAVCALAALFIVLLTAYTRHKFQDVPNVKLFSFVDALPRMGYAFGYYIQKTLLPTGLSPFVGWPVDFWVRLETTVMGLAVFGVLLVLGRGRLGVILLLGAFAVGLAPSLGILRLGRFVAADRYTYLASMALAPLLAGFFLWVKGRLGTPWTLVFSGIWLAILSALGTASFQETKAWRDSRSLWEHAMHHGGEIFADVHSNLGGALESEGRYAEALAAYDHAIAIDPLFPDAHIGRGVVLYRLGRLDEAIGEAEIAVKYGGDYTVAWQNLAAFLVAKKRYVDARPVVEKALSLAPESSALLYLSGQLHADLGDYSQAHALFARAAALKPQWVDPHIALGAMLVLLGQKAEGRAILEKVVAAHPESTAARATLEAMVNSN